MVKIFEEHKKDIIIIISTIILLIISKYIFDIRLFLIAYILIGHEIIFKAIKKIISLDPIDENFLMTIATLGAFILGEYEEAIFVMLFYNIGELFEDIAIDNASKNIKDLVSFKPTIAYIETENNKSEAIDPKDIKIGDILYVKVGDKIPVDAIVIEGMTELDTSIITGESIPRVVKIGDTIESGLINIGSFIKIKAIKLYNDSTAIKIIELIENANDKKSKSENFITRFAKIYTPIVCILSILVFITPLILHFIYDNNINIMTWGYRALTLLVISCPCAIVLSIPLAFFSSIGKASKNGILIKGTNFIESMSKLKSIAFDKTGTMTKGVFEVVGIHHSKMTNDDILMYAAHAEYYSNHPIAKSIVRAYNKNINEKIIKNTKEISGYGIESYIDNKHIILGNDKIMNDNNIKYLECHDNGTIVHIAIDNIYQGHIVVNDVIKNDAKLAIDLLKKQGVNNIMMLTGDNKNTALDVGKKLGIDDIRYELKPEDKLNIVENVLNNKKNDEIFAFVGDGINDAPSIKRADIGISMGAQAVDAAIEVSDIVILKSSPTNINKLLKISKRAMFTIYFNVSFALITKISFIILSALGVSNMWLAVIADVGVMILCVINSLLILI